LSQGVFVVHAVMTLVLIGIGYDRGSSLSLAQSQRSQPCYLPN